jgi:8-oxo-dGTP pyrophosphatase MutT (NUDIX family)
VFIVTTNRSRSAVEALAAAPLAASYPACVELIVPLRRWGYRAAYAALRGYWFVARPQTSGVKCVLTDGDRVLLVRHSYGPRGWDLPGGSIKSGESPASAARREMQEELGLSVDSWDALGELEVEIDYRRDRIHCFKAELHSPVLRLDRGELLTADWFLPGELPRVGGYTRQILAWAEGRLEDRSRAT